MSSKDKYETQVVVDVTPVSLQCYDTGECPAILALKNTMPSVRIEKNDDGTITAKCPIKKYQEAQGMVNTVCSGCRHR